MVSPNEKCYKSVSDIQTLRHLYKLVYPPASFLHFLLHPEYKLSYIFYSVTNVNLSKKYYLIYRSGYLYGHLGTGFMVESEKKIVEMMDARSPMAKYWMPLVWATNIINRARKDSLIKSDQLVQTLLMELSEIRRRLGSVISYDTVCVPLVYTQVRLKEQIFSFRLTVTKRVKRL